MTIKVGIPRALLYYEFERLWTTFYEQLGAEVVISGPTNKYILDQGSSLVVAEACLPVKVFFGHTAQLAEQVDYLFVPRVVSVERKAYICPKVMGLPDMLVASQARLPQVIKPTFNRVSSDRIDNFLLEAASCLTSNKELIGKAWRAASSTQEEYELRQTREFAYPLDTSASLSILIIGHSYLIFDNFLNMNLLKKLQGLGCNVILPQHISHKWKDLSLSHLPKQIFWSYGRDLLGATYCFSQLPGPKGVILLTSFGCGIDSFIDNMILRHLNRKGIPHLNLTLDEHTGEAGLDTRIEAFTDMMRWRRTVNENYLPSYGEYLGTFKGTSGICGTGSNSTTAL